MSRRKRQYTNEFKEDVVRHLLETKKPLVVVARELDVTPSALFRWRAEFGGPLGYQPSVVSTTATQVPDAQRELESLRRKVRELEEDKAILKKAAAFFAKESLK